MHFTLLRLFHEHAEECDEYEDEGIQILDDPCVRHSWIGSDDGYIGATESRTQLLNGTHHLQYTNA